MLNLKDKVEEFFGIRYFKLGKRCKKQWKFLKNNQLIKLMSTEDILKSYKEMTEIFIEAQKVGIAKPGDYENFGKYLACLRIELSLRKQQIEINEKRYNPENPFIKEKDFLEAIDEMEFKPFLAKKLKEEPKIEFTVKGTLERK